MHRDSKKREKMESIFKEMMSDIFLISGNRQHQDTKSTEVSNKIQHKEEFVKA
jgi:heme-degrading monooxygenase HmoA